MQYHRMIRTGTYLSYEINFAVLIISLLMLGLFSNSMFQIGYIYKFVYAQMVLKESLWSYFTIHLAQYMKLDCSFKNDL